MDHVGLNDTDTNELIDDEERKRLELRKALHDVQLETAKQLESRREREYYAKNFEKNIKKAIAKEQKDAKKLKKNQ